MEMTKQPNAKQSSNTSASETIPWVPRPSAPPFSSESERRRLEQELLLPSSPNASSSSTSRSTQAAQQAAMHQNVQSTSVAYAGSNFANESVPTAVAVMTDNFYENGAPPMAMAMAMAAPMSSSSTSASLSNAPLHNNIAATSNQERSSSQSGTETKNSSYSKREDDILVRPEPPTSTTSTHPYTELAHSIPPAPSSTTPHPQLQKQQLKQAQMKGEMSSKLENAGIARAHREARYGEQYETKEKVKMANDLAGNKVGRWDEGLTVDEGAHRFVERGSATSGSRDGREDKVNEDDVSPYGTVDPKTGKRGYEVAEYDVKEYDCGEYDISEYKSVYD